VRAGGPATFRPSGYLADVADLSGVMPDALPAAKLTDMARWANRRIWRYAPFEDYGGSIKSARRDRFDRQTGLFG
jgi:hypothetical protein